MTEKKTCHRLTGDMLKELREMAGWSQAEMGRALGFRQSQICMMEAGQREIPTELFLSIKSRMLRHNEKELQRQEAVRARIKDYPF